MAQTFPRTETSSSANSALNSPPIGRSPDATVVNIDATCLLVKEPEDLKQTNETSGTPSAKSIAESGEKSGVQVTEDGAEIKISQFKKWSLLAVFCLGFFVDVFSYAAFFIFTDPIAEDLDVPFTQQSWIITSYAVTFAAFLLFWGRVSDLYSAKPVFTWGFLALGIINLVISFLPDRFSFFILRAIAGILGATLIPAAYRLIVALFEPHELAKAFTIYGMTGPVANTMGALISGFLAYIPLTGQGAPWRWVFRLLAAIVCPIAIGCLFWIPKPPGSQAGVKDKWKRLDLVGCSLMLVSIILLILGLTMGASHGWKTPAFLVPFLLAWPLAVGFFFWEARLEDEYALIPAKTWKIPNFAVLIVFALYIYTWWSVLLLPVIEIYLKVYNEKPIIAAIRTLPQALSAAFAIVVLIRFPKIMSKPRWPVAFCTLLSIIGFVLFTQWDGDNQTGPKYWSLMFVGGVVGSGGTMAAFSGTNVAIMTSVPAEMAGVAGAVLQVSLQVSSCVSLAIQAGLMTINEGGIYNFKNVQASWYFELGMGIIWLIGFLVLYRPSKDATSGEEDGAEQGESKKVVMAH